MEEQEVEGVLAEAMEIRAGNIARMEQLNAVGVGAQFDPMMGLEVLIDFILTPMQKAQYALAIEKHVRGMLEKALSPEVQGQVAEAMEKQRQEALVAGVSTEIVDAVARGDGDAIRDQFGGVVLGEIGPNGRGPQQ